MDSSHQKLIADSEYKLRLVTFNHEAEKHLQFLFHDSRNGNFPSDPSALYMELEIFVKNKQIHLDQDQRKIVLSANKRTDSRKFDVTLLSDFLVATGKLNKRKEKNIRGLKHARNFIMHNPNITYDEFQKQWNNMEKHLSWLGYKINIVKDLKSGNLDDLEQFQVSINKSKIEIQELNIQKNADDIEINRDDIEQNIDDIEVNIDDIKVNKPDIKVNKDEIKVNKGDIKVNKDDIKVNKDDIKVNKDDIKVNKDDIKVNKDDIKVNKDDIKVNKDDIKVNKDEIKMNKDDIKMNKKNIKENRNVIHTMKESLIPRLNAMEQQIYKDLAGQNKDQGDKTMTKKNTSSRNTSSRATKQITFLNIKNLIAHNNIDKVRDLLQFHPEIVHIRDVDYQRTLLMLAALYTDSATMVALLISHGSNVWAEDFYKSNVYHYAAAFGRQKILQMLCDHDVTNINNLTLTNETPFYLAAWYCQIECVDVLLRQHGIDITIKSKTGKTAYDVAGKNIKKKVVRKLKTS